MALTQEVLLMLLEQMRVVGHCTQDTKMRWISRVARDEIKRLQRIPYEMGIGQIASVAMLSQAQVVRVRMHVWGTHAERKRTSVGQRDAHRNGREGDRGDGGLHDGPSKAPTFIRRHGDNGERWG